MPIKAVRGVRDILPAEARGRSTFSAANRPFSLALGFSVPEFRFPYVLDHSVPGSTIRARRLIEAPWPRFRVISRPGPAPSATPARRPLGPGTCPALTEVELERIVTSKRERLQSAILTRRIIERHRDRRTREAKYVIKGSSVEGEEEIVTVVKLGPTGKTVILTVYVE